MSNPTPTVDVQAVAAKHRAMWAWGDYPKLAAELVAPLGPVLVEATGVDPGDRVLDVAAGTGNAAIPAAQTGASVVASDLCPELLERGRALAAEQGVELEWREANAHALPFGDNAFDVEMFHTAEIAVAVYPKLALLARLGELPNIVILDAAASG